MNDYNELIESLRSMEPMVCSTAADAIEALQSRVAELESRLEISPLHNVDGIMARDATIKLQDERIAELERRLREAEDKKTAGGGSPLKRLQTLSARVAELEAERAELEKQEPVTTVEDRYNADGKSCHITDDLPAGMPLYAAPPVAAPVRPNDSELEMIARSHGTGGWQTLGDMVTFARAIETAVLRANGFKVDE